MHEFTALTAIPAASTRLVTLGIDFCDSTQNIQFDLIASGRPIRMTLRPPVGELIRPVTCTEGYFINEQGKDELTFLFLKNSKIILVHRKITRDERTQLHVINPTRCN